MDNRKHRENSNSLEHSGKQLVSCPLPRIFELGCYCTITVSSKLLHTHSVGTCILLFINSSSSAFALQVISQQTSTHINRDEQLSWTRAITWSLIISYLLFELYWNIIELRTQGVQYDEMEFTRHEKRGKQFQVQVKESNLRIFIIGLYFYPNNSFRKSYCLLLLLQCHGENLAFLWLCELEKNIK